MATDATVLLQPGVDIRPKINASQSKALLESLYGVKCASIVELNGYDDKNYKVALVPDGGANEFMPEINETGYVLKVMNSLDSRRPAVVEAQTQMMLFLGQKGVKCPRPVLNKRGEFFTLAKLDSGDHVVRLLEFVPGRMLCAISPTPDVFYDVGRYLATVDTALKDFRHSAYEAHKSMWMYESVPDLKRFLYVVEDEHDKRMITAIVDEFEARVLSNLDGLEQGVIHGDFNEQNILVRRNTEDRWRVDAILDFGDSQYSCLLFELTIALAYMVLQAKETDVAGHVLAGYTTVRRIPQCEYELLKICIAARFCQSLVLGLYSSRQDPSNQYIRSTQATGWTLLRQLWNEPEDKLYDAWRRIAEGYQ